ncbi:MAG: polyhydroxyalkanoate synthesis regulator DNA-binding domain-containing protein [Thermodesulfobacteriota bacterium]
MLLIKKYANGKLYDTLNKEYITREQLSDIIKSKKKCKVVLSSTGKDVTKAVTAQLTAASSKKKEAPLKPENIKKWISNQVDTRINKVLEIMNLANKEQVQKLNNSLKKLAQKVEELERIQARQMTKAQKPQTKPAVKPEMPAEKEPEQISPSLGQNA